MKGLYVVRLQPIPAVADLTQVDATTFEVNRIRVPAKHRGFGHGSELLQKVTADADRYGASLVLWLNPYGPLSREGLIGWYERNGFVLLPEEAMWDMRRGPLE